MKKFLVKNTYHGGVEIVYGKKTMILNEGCSITLTEQELESIPKHKKYLLGDFLAITEIMEEKDTIETNKVVEPIIQSKKTIIGDNPNRLSLFFYFYRKYNWRN